MDLHNEECLESTRAFWSRKYDRELTTEDAREISRNISGFFSVLSRWAEKDRARMTTDSKSNHEQ